MIFLIRHDRESGNSDWVSEFTDAEMEEAQAHRLQIEIAARNDDPRPEIVILSAQRKDDLRRTHAKYFGVEAVRDNIRSSIG